MLSWRNWNYAEDELHAFLVRRNPTDPTDEAYFRVFAPAGTSLQTLVRVAGRRWTVEECFELAKGEVGLSHYQVRQWQAWYRAVTLAMLALAFLAVLHAVAQQLNGEKKVKTLLLSRFLSLKFAICSTLCCGCLSPLSKISWLGHAGVLNTSFRLNRPIFVANSVFSPECSRWAM